MSEETKMWEAVQCLPDAVEHLIHGDPDDADSVKASDAVRWAIAEIAQLREERKPVVVMPMPFEPWRHGPLSYAKCEIIAALKKAGVKWQPLPPGPEPKEPNRE